MTANIGKGMWKKRIILLKIFFLLLTTTYCRKFQLTSKIQVYKIDIQVKCTDNKS